MNLDGSLLHEIAFISVTICAGLCVVAGVVLFRAVRKSRLGPVLACLLYGSFVLGSVLLTIPVSKAVAAILGHDAGFSGEADVALALGVIIMLPIGALAIVAFITGMCYLQRLSRQAKCKADQRSER